MSTAVAKRELTVEEYLALDSDADEARYEYLDGQVSASPALRPSTTLSKIIFRESCTRYFGRADVGALPPISASKSPRPGMSTPTWRSSAARPSAPTSRRRRS